LHGAWCGELRAEGWLLKLAIFEPILLIGTITAIIAIVPIEAIAAIDATEAIAALYF
jgi:hypothetical protein